MTPSFLNGRNKEDLAPITAFIFPVASPLQIIFFLFAVIPECHTAASNPKYSLNFFSNSLVKPISGISINACKPLFNLFSMLLK